jgi:hypothetical protein
LLTQIDAPFQTSAGRLMERNVRPLGPTQLMQCTTCRASRFTGLVLPSIVLGVWFDMCFEDEINHKRVDDSLASKAKTPVPRTKMPG